MKSTGVVRQLDTLGRVVLPIELRRTMDIGVKDMLEIFVDGDEIILKKYHPSCIFCSDARDVVPYKGKLVCKKCLEELRNAKEKPPLVFASHLFLLGDSLLGLSLFSMCDLPPHRTIVSKRTLRFAPGRSIIPSAQRKRGIP